MGNDQYIMARGYRDEFGFSVIPVKANKKPAVSWLEFQHRKCTDQELDRWFRDGNYNVGIITGSISGIAVIDIDTAEGQDNLKSICPEVFDAPTVFTPRGGFHLYHAYSDGIRNNAGTIVGTDLRAEGGYVVAPPSIGPNGKQYSWKEPPETLSGVWPALPQAYIDALNKFQVPEQEPLTADALMFSQGRRDNDLFHLAHTLLRGGMPRSEVVTVVVMAAKSCSPPLDEATALQKVKSAIDRFDRAERNLSEEIRNYVSGTKGYFMLNELQKDLGLYSVRERKAASVALTRLVSDKVIEHYGNRSGVYRKYDTSLEEMDWLNSAAVPFDIELPLGLSDLVTIYPNNIIVVAGSPDAGKTAFMLDLVKRNMANHDIHYFNSEMGEQELRLRIEAHDDIAVEDWNFKAWSRPGDFADVIKPASINVIDYLEISDAFYKVAAELNDIYRKLDGGICVIGLQKKPGSDMGRGASFSLEKPRLYLAMDCLDHRHGRIKIIKAKNRRNRFHNPNGLVRSFEVYAGAKFECTSDWYLPDAPDQAKPNKADKLF